MTGFVQDSRALHFLIIGSNLTRMIKGMKPSGDETKIDNLLSQPLSFLFHTQYRQTRAESECKKRAPIESRAAIKFHMARLLIMQMAFVRMQTRPKAASL
jgi:hypothetical protein